MKPPPPLTPTALRTRWALLALASGDRPSGHPARRPPAASISAMGLHFPSPLGLAAGFDRSGTLVGQASRIGLGAVEIGSVSAGSRELTRVIQALRRREGTPGTIHGVSLVKRPATPWPRATAEFIDLLHQLHGLADYLTINPGRDCPDPELLAGAIETLAATRDRLARSAPPAPLVAKLPSRWLASRDPAKLAQTFTMLGADGLLLATDSHPALDPLALLHQVSRAFGPEICLISVGGIATPQDIRRRLAAGASLVQAHTVLRRSNRRDWLGAAAALQRLRAGQAGARRV